MGLFDVFTNVNWVNLAFPFIYLAVLVGALSTFSSLYRKRKACKQSSPNVLPIRLLTSKRARTLPSAMV